jgi:hypothetical protein
MTTYIKDPDANLDYFIDWTPWLGADTIVSATWIVPTGITKTAQTNTTTGATVWLSGGTMNYSYTVTCRVVTAGGRTDDRSFTVQVQQQ